MQLTKAFMIGLFLSAIFICLSCQQRQKPGNKEIATEEIEATENNAEQPFESIDFDMSDYNKIMKGLNGIEKFYVQEDLYRLHSLLKFKDDERYKSLEIDLSGKYEYPTFITVSILDQSNGYIEFSKLQTECVQVIVYWNKANGDKLIGHSQKCCTMFCEGDISFQLYNQNAQTYLSVSTNEVIGEIDSIKKQRPDDHIEGDGFDYEFRLPRTGKNIRYCLGEKCLDLLWQDGSFSIEESQD